MNKNRIDELKVALNTILEAKQEKYINDQNKISDEILNDFKNIDNRDELLQALYSYQIKLNALTYNNLRELITDSICNILDSLQD